MSKKDFYELLEVDRGADDKALKSAYRKKAMKYHPDRNPGDATAEARFKEINEAYDILKDPDKRAAYDQYGHAAFEGGAGGQGGFGGRGGPEGFDFGDIFEEFFGGAGAQGGFGGGRRRRGPGGQSATRGADLRYNMEITLEEAFTGKSEQVTIPTSESCGDCGGSGAEKGSQPEVCGTCGGHGKVRASQGFFMVERTCPTCGGQGTIIKNPCRSCSGTGRVTKDKTLEVTIPKGVEDGTRLRISGAGEAGLRGGPSGDLYIFLTIKSHPIFKRDSEMLFCEVPIPMTKAALGGKIEVPTIGGGRVSVKIPEGTQSGRQFRLRGKGMPALNSGGYVGDMILEAHVETPSNLTARQRELLEEFAAECGDDVSPESKGFFDKVKDIFAD